MVEYVDIPALPLVRTERGWAEQSPEVCPACGAAWGPWRVVVGWTPCDCHEGRQGAPCGHRTYRCRTCKRHTRVGHPGGHR